MRSMVEGHALPAFGVRIGGTCRSTTFGGPPPRSGEDRTPKHPAANPDLCASWESSGTARAAMRRGRCGRVLANGPGRLPVVPCEVAGRVHPPAYMVLNSTKETPFSHILVAHRAVPGAEAGGGEERLADELARFDDRLL